MSLDAAAITTGTANFYVDADWTGAQSGTAAQPWSNVPVMFLRTNLAIALSNGPVTIYFNSRQHGTNLGVDLSYTPNTAFGSYLLTFDGHSFYNASETSPAWTTETNSANLAGIQFVSSEDPNHLKRSLVTVHGLAISTPGSGDCPKAVTIAGDNWIVEDCNITVQPGAISGPTVYLCSTSDAAHGGSDEWTPPCTNIIIRTNVIHDTFGEAVYLGGGATFTNWSDPGAGYPSHSHIWVQGNTIYNTAYHATTQGQGDGVDIKGGIDFLTVEGNNIYAINDPNDNGTRPIVMQGQTNGDVQVRIIRNNYIHDCFGVQDGAISVGNSWGVVQGLQIYNNLIVNIQGGGLYGTNGYVPAGIDVYQSQDTIQIFNNTIYNCSGSGILAYVTNGPFVLTNNLIWGNNSNGVQITLKPGNPVHSDYNAYAGNWGFAGEGSHSIALTGTAMANTVVSLAVENFQVATGAPIVGMGYPLNSLFTTDMAGNIRGSSWDMGALNNSPLLLAPTGFHIVHY